MEHPEEEMSAIHHENLPISLTQTEVSSDESEGIDSEGEDRNGELGGEDQNHLKYVTSSVEAEVHSKGLPTTANVEESPVESDGDEGDYEEPKLNGAATSPPDAEEFQIAAEIGDASAYVENANPEEDESTRCPKCDELINSDEKVSGFSCHVNCFRCAHCDSLITNQDFKLIDGMPYCRPHCAHLSSGDGADEEVDVLAAIPNVEYPASMQTEKTNGQDLSHEEPRFDDVLPPTGSAKRLVEQWSNIEAHKANQSTSNSAQLDSAPKYAPNTAKTIAAKFSAGIADDQPSPKPRNSVEPTEHLPTQGQARGLIAKFSAMHA